MKRSYHGQMSESFVVGILLCLCGGFQDAYTYVCRDKVFANAQTGNIVLLGNHLAQQDWSGAVRYAVPILAFTAGIFVAQKAAISTLERAKKSIGDSWYCYWK